MTKNPFFKYDLSRKLTSMVQAPTVIYREKDDDTPGLTTMMTLSSAFLLEDREMSLHEVEIHPKYVFPVLHQFASVCDNYTYLVTAAPGRSEQCSNGGPVYYQQVLFDTGVIPVLVRCEYEPKSSSMLITISIKVGVAIEGSPRINLTQA